MNEQTTEQKSAQETLDALGTPDNRRDELRAKIEASERRIAQRTLADEAREVADAAVSYTKENPLKVLGGAIVAGLVVGLMTKPGRRAARNAAAGTASAVSGVASGTVKSVGTAAKKRTSRFGSVLADALVAYGMKVIDEAIDAGRAGQDALEDIGDATTSRARRAKRDAEYMAASAADNARTVTRRTRRRATRAVRDLKDRVSN